MERRLSRRFLCAELVEVRWKDKAGRLRRSAANLENISRCGACVQMEETVPLEMAIVIRCEGGDLPGTVRYCLYRDGSYFVGIGFAEGTRWSRRWYRPEHMLDPRELVIRAARRSRMISQAPGGVRRISAANALCGDANAKT